MSALVWHDRPNLRRPVLIAAFEGWSDAGDAASGSVQYLIEHWDAKLFASIDGEDYFDFTEVRPRIRFNDDGNREISWPKNELYVAPIPGVERDLVVLSGSEPQLRWKTFCGHIVEAAKSLDTTMAITMGALLAEVPHTRPVSVMGSSQDTALGEIYAFKPSQYEGPAGITSVLNQLLHEAEIPTAALWAAVPSYIPGAPAPKATLALVERAVSMLGASIKTTDLEIASASYERQLDELVKDDEETEGYLRSLEERYDSDSTPLSSTSFIDEVEQFLREHPND